MGPAGPAGPQGLAGAPGKDGRDGVSPPLPFRVLRSEADGGISKPAMCGTNEVMISATCIVKAGDDRPGATDARRQWRKLRCKAGPKRSAASRHSLHEAIAAAMTSSMTARRKALVIAPLEPCQNCAPTRGSLRRLL